MFDPKLKTARDLLAFISRCPSPYHAVASLSHMLVRAGYAPLRECDEWELVPGGKYFVTRSGTSVIAFRLPENAPKGFMISAAHSDAPTFKLKENPEMSDSNYVRLNTEGYGGMIMSTWLDRPLSVAGRVTVDTVNGIETRLVALKRDLAVIPNVAIHMNRQVNTGYAFNAAKDLVPLIGTGKAKGTFASLLEKEAKLEEGEKILGADLFLYNRAEGTLWGADSEFISSPKLDDLQCAYALMHGLIASEGSDAVQVCAVFDNEEVGSSTKQGADSTFLSDTLRTISQCLGIDEGGYRRLLASSMMVSADNGHAVHPNHPEYADPTNRPVMNGGVVIKQNGNQKYATDAVSQAIFRKVCEKAEVPVQFYANRSDIAGGSTLGSISDTHVSIPTVDVGLAQLAMHSSYETGGAYDTVYMTEALRVFHSSSLKVTVNGYELC